MVTPGGFSKWRFRKWKVFGSEGWRFWRSQQGPKQRKRILEGWRFWVFQGFHRFPEGFGARLSEVPPDSWGYLCSVDPICGTPAFPGVLSCWTHSCSTGALGLLGEEVDFDWKGWQEYLVRWALVSWMVIEWLVVIGSCISAKAYLLLYQLVFKWQRVSPQRAKIIIGAEDIYTREI